MSMIASVAHARTPCPSPPVHTYTYIQTGHARHAHIPQVTPIHNLVEYNTFVRDHNSRDCCLDGHLQCDGNKGQGPVGEAHVKRGQTVGRRTNGTVMGR